MFGPGSHDDAIGNQSPLVDMTRTLPPWPHDETNWREVVDCITAALAPFPRLAVTETDPGDVSHIEIVFTTTYWAGAAGTTMVIPASCRPGNQLAFVFGDALPTSARACHVAMKGFAQMTALLSLGDNCHDFVNDALDCSPTRAFLDETVNCVDSSNQPVACRCGGGATQNSFEAIETTFPACP